MMLLRFSRGSRQRNTNSASGNSRSKNGTARRSWASSRASACPHAAQRACWSRRPCACSTCGRFLPRPPRLRDARRAGWSRHPQRRAVTTRICFDEPVRLAAERRELRRHGQCLEQQRAAGAGGRHDEDRPFERQARPARSGRRRFAAGAGGRVRPRHLLGAQCMRQHATLEHRRAPRTRWSS